MPRSALYAFLEEVYCHNERLAEERRTNPSPPPTTFVDDETPTKPPRKRPRSYILIVDDDPDIRELFADELRGCGWDVDTAGDGNEAFAILHREFMDRKVGEEPRLPCVVLLDAYMPNMDGFEFFAAMRANPVFAKLHVIVMSAPENIAKFAPWAMAGGSRDGVSAAIKKPAALDELVQKVVAICGLPE
jgi:CheY-like chemotaxis protein